MAKKIVYVGIKAAKSDNVAQTGLTWQRGEVLEVQDDKKAQKLLEHSDIWADAEKPYDMVTEIPPTPAKPPEPRISLVPQGGENTNPFWNPIVIPVTAEEFQKIQDKELVPVFLTTDEIGAYGVWKKRVESAARMRATSKDKKAEAA